MLAVSVAVNASTITPLRAAVPVKQGTEDVGNRAALLQPLLTIWGRLNKTVDGENVTDQAFDADMNPIPWITKYIDVGALASPDGTLKEPLAANGSLAEGQYRLSVKVRAGAQAHGMRMHVACAWHACVPTRCRTPHRTGMRRARHAPAACARHSGVARVALPRAD